MNYEAIVSRMLTSYRPSIILQSCLEKMFYFFHLHDMRDEPKNTVYPVMDFLEIVHVTQSEYAKPDKSKLMLNKINMLREQFLNIVRHRQLL